MPETAIILAGGSGFLDGSLMGTIPKLLLPIANRPLADYLASALWVAGARRLIVCLDGTSADAETRISENFRDSSMKVECIVQEALRGTGGSVKDLEGALQGEAFWVLGGDLLLGTDLRHMLAVHREHGSVATVAVVRVQESPWEMERVEIDACRRIKAIHRIHPAQNKRSMLRPVGLYLFEPVVLELIPQGHYFDLKEQLFPRLADKGTSGSVWEVSGYCRTLVSVSDYFTANRDVLLDRVKFPDMQGWQPAEVRRWAEPQVPSSTVMLNPVAIGQASSIGDKTMIVGPTAIGLNCVIKEGAVLTECVVLPDAKVGKGARLDRCILGEGSEVEDGAVLREVIVLEKPSQVSDLLSSPGRYVPLNSSGLMRAPGWWSRAQQAYLFGKRYLDAVFAAAALILFAPLLAFIAVAVKLDSEGPVIFRQRRCGRGGIEFTMYKFRTMVNNSEDLKRELMSSNEVDGPMFKIVADPRITRVGRFLRATNLDELPQLWNILRGDMSLVGPRPLSMDEMRYNPRWRDIRLSVRPGLTGLWQAEAHTELSFADWIRYDIHYVRKVSPWLDLKILFKSIFTVIGEAMR
jgi:lipopolysaccharide/colanic/teichoic acid biosynthesis glycosyltransferase/NDP-sugar pyrophosphorylase family protein